MLFLPSDQVCFDSITCSTGYYTKYGVFHIDMKVCLNCNCGSGRGVHIRILKISTEHKECCYPLACMLITCIYVCVCVPVTTLPVASFISTLKLRYKKLYYGILLIFSLWIKTALFSVICLRQQHLVLLQQPFIHFCNDRGF